jgi:pyruvate/2-oxoglutarate dehydrogenase complex dihydrolipoamide acyltransferase (E2) component
MDGGTFTISNGGVFGSLFGTPIINPPQSAILGMHGIFDRPVAVNGKVCAIVIQRINSMYSTWNIFCMFSLDRNSSDDVRGIDL